MVQEWVVGDIWSILWSMYGVLVGTVPSRSHTYVVHSSSIAVLLPITS